MVTIATAKRKASVERETFGQMSANGKSTIYYDRIDDASGVVVPHGPVGRDNLCIRINIESPCDFWRLAGLESRGFGSLALLRPRRTQLQSTAECGEPPGA